MKSWSDHIIHSRWRSSWSTGTFLKACSIFILASSALRPSFNTCCTASWTVRWASEHNQGSIPSLMLKCLGRERSRMSLHGDPSHGDPSHEDPSQPCSGLHGWADFDITPNPLIWNSGMEFGSILLAMSGVVTCCKNVGSSTWLSGRHESSANRCGL